MSNRTLNDVFQNQLNVLYGAEKDIQPKLTKMAGAARSAELRSELETQASESAARVGRLDDVFKAIGAHPDSKACKCYGGLMDNCSEAASEKTNEDIRDVVLIAAAQGVQVNEIAGYENAHAWAKALKLDKAGELLEKTLSEEKASNKRLRHLAGTLTVAHATAKA